MNEADKKVIEELLDRQSERLEKRMDTRFQEQAEHFEKRMIHIFNEGFEQVILPHIVELSDKIDSLDNKVDDLGFRTESIERKVNAIIDRQDRQSEEIKGIKKFIQMPEGA